MRIFTFGNGNIPLERFISHYTLPLIGLIREHNPIFILCDFRGTDTLMMEFLKNLTPKVVVYHMGDKPRYTPDNFRTYASSWQFMGRFASDQERDFAAIAACTHFLAYDFNTDENRKSGTQRNIETCLSLQKIDLRVSLDQ